MSSNLVSSDTVNNLSADTSKPTAVSGGTVIGANVKIMGDNIQIVTEDSIQIDGELTSDVRGKMVTIGQEGAVTGKISAETVDVLGTVNGSIAAAAVTLHNQSKVDGKIAYGKLTISDGAIFNGSAHKEKDAGKES